MLAIDTQSVPLGAAEQFGLDVLVDLSRLVRFDGEGEVTRLRIVEGEAGTLQSCTSSRWRMQLSDGCVIMPRGVLRLVTSIAGAEDEQRSALRDRFGRVPPEVNALVASGRERIPVISRAAVALRHAVVEAAGRRPVLLLSPWPDGRQWAVALTHDVDVVAMWPAFTALRLLELARKREGRRIISVLAAAVRSIGGRPVWDGIRTLLEAERQQSVRSTWFVLCGSPTFATARAGDLTYRIESAAGRRIVSAVASAGHEIGLHGSFETYVSGESMRAQRERLAAVIRQPDGVRQHYLRMIPGVTQRAMAAAGFAYDSTFGFADRNGFRLGVADVVPAWDASTRAPAGLDEVPFVWMDRALSKYAGVETPSVWVDDALALARVTREVQGLWTGVWHPNLTPALGFPGSLDAYRRLLQELTTHAPWTATLHEVTLWRRARRAVRAARLNADGSILVEPLKGNLEPIQFEDANGRVRQDVVRIRQ